MLKVNLTVNSKRGGVLFVTDDNQGEILMRLLFGEGEEEARVLQDPAWKRELRRREAPNSIPTSLSSDRQKHKA